MSFGKQLRKARLEIISETDDMRKAITIELFNSVILDTPVDTGRARGNWQCSGGSPMLNSVEREDPTGSQATSEVVSKVESSFGDGSMFLSNNLPYIQRLEFGHSKQAPAGMVRKNIARIEQIIREKTSK